MKEVWESKKELLRETGKQVIQQLAEATAAIAPNPELNESSIPSQAVSLCATQVLSGSPDKSIHFYRFLSVRYYSWLRTLGKYGSFKKLA